jgi:hypothetical protein
MSKKISLWLLPISYLCLTIFWFTPEIVMKHIPISKAMSASIVYLLRWFFLISTLVTLFMNLELYSKKVWFSLFHKIRIERKSIIFLFICTILIILTSLPMFKIIEGFIDSDMSAAGLFALKIMRGNSNYPIYIGCNHHIGNFDTSVILFLLSIFPEHTVIYCLPQFILFLIFIWIFYFFIRSILDTRTAIITTILFLSPALNIRIEWIRSTSNTILWLLLATISIFLTKKIVEQKFLGVRPWGILGFICGYALWQREPFLATTFICILYLLKHNCGDKKIKKVLVFMTMFFIGIFPALFYNLQNNMGTLNFLKFWYSKEPISIDLMQIIKKFARFCWSVVDYIFAPYSLKTYLNLQSDSLKWCFLGFVFITVIFFIVKKFSEIKNFIFHRKVQIMSSEIFLLVFIAVMIQATLNPISDAYPLTFTHIRFFYPAIIFLYPIFGYFIYLIFQRIKILGVLLIALFFINQFIDYKVNFLKYKNSYFDLQKCKKIFEEKKVMIIHAGYWFDDSFDLITSGKYYFSSKIGPDIFFNRRILTKEKPSANAPEVIIAIREARNYVKEFFLISRIPYKSIILKTLDIYYDYPRESIKYFDKWQPVLFSGQNIFEYNKSLNLNIKCKKGDSIALDVIYLKNYGNRVMNSQIIIANPKGKIIKIPKTPIPLKLPVHPGLNIYKFPKILNLKFDDSVPYYVGPGKYKIIPLLLDPKTNKVLNDPPVITEIEVTQ